MKLEDYFRYADQVKEERPLYLFDPKFGEKVARLGSEYEVPVYFREDLFGVLGNERPDYRWIIIGPAGSGSSFHVIWFKNGSFRYLNVMVLKKELWY
jgi:hypothetical protein